MLDHQPRGALLARLGFLEGKGGGMSRVSFHHVPAEDESVDAEDEVFLDGVKTNLAIQHGLEGNYSVNRYSYEAGELAGMSILGFFETLAEARAYVRGALENANG
jgi:hypothetical protein